MILIVDVRNGPSIREIHELARLAIRIVIHQAPLMIKCDVQPKIKAERVLQVGIVCAFF